MRIPDKILDQGHEYIVQHVDYTGEDAEAYIDFEAMEIKLSKNNTASRKSERFFHELCHLAFHGTALRTLLLPDDESRDTEEDFVEAFSQRLWGILQMNSMFKEESECQPQKQDSRL